MALPAFVVLASGKRGVGDGSLGASRSGDERRRWMSAPRQHSDSGKFPFRFERAGKGPFVRIDVE
jgi:hypothetical protein